MPKIPIYDSQVSPRTPDAVQVSDALAQGAQPIKEVAETLGGIEQKFSQLKTLQETTDAHVNLKLELDQIEDQAAKDSDVWGNAAYEAKVNEAVGKHLEGISDPVARLKAQEAFSLEGISSRNSIQKNFRGRQINKAQDNLYQWLGVAEQSYINAANPEDKALQMRSANGVIDGYLNTGMLTDEQAHRWRQAISTQWPLNELRKDADADPDMALNRLKLGAYNISDPETKAKMEAEVYKMKQRRDRLSNFAVKEAKLDNQMQMANAIAEGSFKLSPTDVSNSVMKGEISQDFGLALRNVLTSPNIVTAKTTKGQFEQHLEDVFASKDKEGINNVIIETLRGGSDGKVSSQDLTTLLKVAKAHGDAMHGDLDAKAKWENTQAGFKTINQWQKKFNFDSNTALYGDYFNAVQKGLEPQLAAQTAIKSQIVKKVPEAMTLNDVPNTVYSPQEGLYYLFAGNTKVTPHAIYNPKTGGFDANPDNAESHKK